MTAFRTLAFGGFAFGLALLPMFSAGPAEAKGCIKGAIVGGVAGHIVGHGKTGALAGCVIGHHNANKAERERSQNDQDMQRTR